MKKTKVAKALLPFMLLGSPALAGGSSVRSGSRFKTKKAVVQSSVKYENKLLDNNELKNPFGAFSSSKNINNKQKKSIDVLTFLSENGLLVNTATQNNLFSGDIEMRKSFLACSNAFYTTQTTCTANGHTWTAPDTTAPTLSAVSSNTVDITTANIVATSNESGTMYYVITTSATPPSNTQVLGGQDNTGAAAVKSGNSAVTAATAKTFSVTGLSGGTQYYYYFAAKDAANNVSTVSSGNFTTVAANVIPTISNATAGQTVNDTATLTPFSGITLADTDGDNISMTITLDTNAKGVLSGTGLSGTGPYTLASDTAANVQTKLQALSFNPTDNRVAPALTETTTFSLVANDGTANSITNSTTTVVSTSVNDAPSITSNGGGATAAINAVENTTAVTTVTANDADTGDTKAYSITGGADQTKFSIVPSTGVLTFTSAPNFESPTDVGANNTYEVEVTVSDGDATDVQTITVTVTNNITEAPTVTLSVNSAAVAENGGTSTITATLSEAVSEATTVTIAREATSTATLTSDFTLSSTTITINAGATTGTATLTSVDDLLDDDAETAKIEISAVSGGESATENGTQLQTVTITDDDVSPSLSTLSPVDGSTAASITSNISITFDKNMAKGTGNINIYKADTTLVEAIDVTSGLVSISGATVTINPTADFTLTTGYYVQIDATALDDTDTNSFAGIADTTTWNFTTVSDTTAPTISSINIPNTAMKVGDTVTATITVTSDADNYTTGSGAITGTIDGFTLGSLSKTNDTTYTATFTVADGGTDVASGSNIAVSFTLTDSSGNTSSAYTTAISQASDSVDANIPTLTAVTAASNNTDTTKAKVGDIITLTFTASETLSANPVVTIAGNAATVTNTSGNNYTATHTMLAGDAEGVVPFTIDFSDAATNAGTQVTAVTSGSSVTFDKTAPTVTISAIDISADTGSSAADFLTSTASQTITGTLSTTLAAGDILYGSVDGGSTYSDITSLVTTITTAINWSGVTLSGTSSIKFKVTDAAGNEGAIATQSYTLDTAAPSVTITTNDTALKSGDVATLTFTLSEGSSDFAVGDISVTGGTLSAFATTSATIYTASFTPTASSTTAATIDVASAKFTDAAGNNNTPATQLSINVDTVTPSISSYTPTVGSTGVATTSNLVLGFSESMIKGTGSIYIKAYSDDTVLQTIDVTTAAVSVSGASVTLTHSTPFALNTQYYVTVDATALKDSAGNSFAGIASKDTFKFTSAANSAPTITGASAGQTVNDNSTLTPFSGIILADSESDNISVNITLDDNAKGTLSSTTIASGTLASVQSALRAVVFTPTSNRVAVGSSETSTFSIVANDGTSDSATNSATTVISTSVNDAPTIDTLFANISILEDSNVTNYDINVSDVEGEDINLTVESNNTNILRVTPNWSGWINQATWASPLDFNLTTVANANGLVRITLTADDGNKSSASSFDVNVTAVDDAPVLEIISDVTTTEDFNDLNITLNSTDAEGDTINYSVTSSDTSIATISIINSKLVVTPMENASGTITVEVNATANGQSVIQSFDITLLSVNDMPSIDTIFENISVAKNSGVTNYELNVSDIDGDDLNITVESNNTNILTVTPNWSGWINQATWSDPLDFNLTTQNDAVGLVKITMRVDDGDVNTSQIFDINVTDVNRVPAIESIGDVVAYKNFLDKEIPIIASNVDSSTVYSAALVDNTLADITFTDNILTLSSIDSKSGRSDINVTLSNGDFSSSAIFNLYILPLEDGDDIEEVGNITIVSDENSSTTTLVIDSNLSVETATHTDGSAEHKVVVGGKTIKANSDINGTVVSFTSSGVHTTYSDANISLEVNASVTGQAVHSLSVNGKTTQALSQRIGAITIIDKDENGEIEIVTSVALDNNASVSVKAKADGSAEHSVKVSGGKTSKATSNINGTVTLIKSDGEVETAAGEYDNGDGYLIKAVVITKPNGETVTKFIKVNKTDSNDIEVYSSTLRDTTPYAPGNSVDLTEVGANIYINTTFQLDSDLIVD